MGSLFLVPEATLLWDTYRPALPWSAYALGPVAARLSRSKLAVGPVFMAAGEQATLASWQRVMDPSNRFGLIWLNSSGSPTDFSIVGGPGRPADIPGGCPAVVLMIHSFSAADPTNAGTIAGRWLEQGAFVYFGSVSEPYLMSFRIPALVAELSAEGMPLSAAIRQGESEPFGRPWRLEYLGDPLYRVPRAEPRLDRMSPDSWRKLDPAYDAWAVVELAATGEPPPLGGDEASAGRLLEWCRTAAIVEAAGGGPRPGNGWHKALRDIPRERLAPRLRGVLDDILIDALGQTGEWDELRSRLVKVPPGELGPRAWIAIETGTMQGLARAGREADAERGFTRALDMWDEAVRLHWPGGSDFPDWMTRRVANMAEADAGRGLPAWRDRLRRTADEMAGDRARFPYVLVVAAERVRIESRLGRRPMSKATGEWQGAEPRTKRRGSPYVPQNVR